MFFLRNSILSNFQVFIEYWKCIIKAQITRASPKCISCSASRLPMHILAPWPHTRLTTPISSLLLSSQRSGINLSGSGNTSSFLHRAHVLAWTCVCRGDNDRSIYILFTSLFSDIHIKQKILSTFEVKYFIY